MHIPPIRFGTVFLTALFISAAEVTAFMPKDGVAKEPTTYSGTINQTYEIEMKIVRKGRSISGEYFYLKNKKPIQLQGSLGPQGSLHLDELSDGKKTGSFDGTMLVGRDSLGEKIDGTWTRAKDKKAMSFSVRKIDAFTNNWKTYRSSKLKIEFKYPAYFLANPTEGENSIRFREKDEDRHKDTEDAGFGLEISMYHGTFDDVAYENGFEHPEEAEARRVRHRLRHRLKSPTLVLTPVPSPSPSPTEVLSDVWEITGRQGMRSPATLLNINGKRALIGETGIGCFHEGGGYAGLCDMTVGVIELANDQIFTLSSVAGAGAGDIERIMRSLKTL